MRYPKFIEKNDLIGICAPSAGVGNKLDEFDESLKVLKNEGYKVIESESVRKKNNRSASVKKRAEEFEELILNKKVKMIIAATGGDYMFEILPYINFENIDNNLKWFMGFSDPTNLLYTITTKLDIATIYGFNGSSYKLDCPKYQKDNLDFIKGNLVKQNSYKKCQAFIDTCNDVKDMNDDVKWISKNKELNIEGRLIGGCFEIISKIIGSKYDYTLDFIERYKNDGIVWFFDVFNMNSFDFYLTLLQMKYAGYFKYTKAILFGRVAFPNVVDKKLDYLKAMDKALGNIPHIAEMDIGHTHPKMTLINGSIVNVKYKDNKGSLLFKLK